jgi:hypothetical protein
MNVLAWSLASTEGSWRRASGQARVITTPPVSVDQFRPGWLEYRDLVMIKLHGWPGDPIMWGDDHMAALSVGMLHQVDLGGAVVFAANCHLPESPFLEALLNAGAGCVVGGSGTNYGGVAEMTGADLLGAYFRRALEVGARPGRALRIAKATMLLSWPSLANSDARQFELFER